MKDCVIVEGWVRLAHGEAERLRPAAVAMAAASRREPGCLDYAFAQDFSEPELIRVIERWVDEAALKAHCATPHMAAFSAALGAAKIVDANVTLYRAAFARTLRG